MSFICCYKNWNLWCVNWGFLFELSSSVASLKTSFVRVLLLILLSMKLKVVSKRYWHPHLLIIFNNPFIVVTFKLFQLDQVWFVLHLQIRVQWDFIVILLLVLLIAVQVDIAYKLVTYKWKSANLNIYFIWLLLTIQKSTLFFRHWWMF